MNSAGGLQANRLVFLSPRAKSDLHISGVPTVDVHGSFTTASGNLGVVLMDYSSLPFTRTEPEQRGSRNAATSTCVGEQDLAAWPLDGCSYTDRSQIDRQRHPVAGLERGPRRDQPRLATLPTPLTRRRRTRSTSP